MPIDEIFRGAAQDNLPRNTNRRIFLEPDWGLLLVLVVEDDGDARFRDTCLAALVDEILQRPFQHLSRTRYGPTRE
jgi:hypothetical protein